MALQRASVVWLVWCVVVWLGACLELRWVSGLLVGDLGLCLCCVCLCAWYLVCDFVFDCCV